MLIRPIFKRFDDPILQLIAALNGNNDTLIEVARGVYEIGHFSGSHMFHGVQNDYPELQNANAYGVCDSWENLAQVCPTLYTDPNRKFVVTLTPIEKSTQPTEDGWRWHKWGPYIGKHTPQCEYLHDEPNIDKVYVYHIYEM
jgi:hypothetical protein